MARLFETVDVVDESRPCHAQDVPMFGRTEWDRVKAVSPSEILARQFAEKVTEQVQRKFRSKRQRAADTEGAEAIGIQDCAAHKADHHIVFPNGRGVVQLGAAPKPV